MTTIFTFKNLLKNSIGKIVLPGCAVAITFGMTPAYAQQNEAVQAQATKQMQTEAQPIYGRQLMTDAERQAHRQKMRSLQTAEQRQEYLQQHHKRMQERARERGVTLPEQPRAKSGKGQGRNKSGMRQGGGAGRGMGAGRNMPRFSDYDADTDGQISQQEFSDGHTKRMQQRVAEGRKMKRMKQAPTFNAIDTDSDGNVSPEEFSAHQAQHMKKMKNRQ